MSEWLIIFILILCNIVMVVWLIRLSIDPKHARMDDHELYHSSILLWMHLESILERLGEEEATAIIMRVDERLTKGQTEPQVITRIMSAVLLHNTRRSQQL